LLAPQSLITGGLLLQLKINNPAIIKIQNRLIVIYTLVYNDKANNFRHLYELENNKNSFNIVNNDKFKTLLFLLNLLIIKTAALTSLLFYNQVICFFHIFAA
jgi:hypothetical protein